MIHTVAVSNYRSLRQLELPFSPLTVISGANGSGKSNVYNALRLLSEATLGTATASLAREGGLPSVLWAGAEAFSRDLRAHNAPVQGGPRQAPVRLRLGFAADTFSYACEFGLSMHQHALLRPLSQAEFSDGTLRC